PRASLIGIAVSWARPPGVDQPRTGAESVQRSRSRWPRPTEPRPSISVATPDLVADHAADDASDRRTAHVAGDAGADGRADARSDSRVAITLAHSCTRRQRSRQDRTDQQFARPFHRKPPARTRAARCRPLP